MSFTRTDKHQVFRDGKVIEETLEVVDITAEVVEIELHNQARAALDTNSAYLAIPSPTAAEVRQQTERLTRQMQALIRVVVRALDVAQ
jgi:hypothetical protein